jgi:hypothetical protein
MRLGDSLEIQAASEPDAGLPALPSAASYNCVMNPIEGQTSRDPPAFARRRDADRRIASVVFVFIIAMILAGFSENFYLRAWLGTRPLIPSAWLHGFIMSAWLILLAIQVLAVARRRIDLHRRIGKFAAALAVLLCVGVDSLRSAHMHRASWVPGIAIVLADVGTCMAQLAA